MSELRILVPLEGSPAAESALPLSAPLFRASPTRLTLLRVVPLDASSVAAEAYLSKVRDALHAHGVDADTAISWGDPAREIVRFAGLDRADLIAMTTQGGGLLGGVAEEVVRRATVPVLLNRPGLGFGKARRLVVPLDGSELAESVLPDVLRIAKALGADVHVVGVVPSLVVAADGFLPDQDLSASLREPCERAAREGLSAVPVILSGSAAAEIALYAEKVQAGLICMATHGRSGLSRVLLGSVAERLLRRAPCPILLRHAPSEVPAEP